MKTLKPLLFSGFLALSASFAFGLDLATPGVEVRIHQAEEKGQSATVAKTPDGAPAVEIIWDNTKRKHAEFSIVPAMPLPAFRTLKISATVYVPDNSQARNFSIRLLDQDQEVFQYTLPIAADESGWKTLSYVIDASQPTKASWGDKKNGRFDFPLRVVGSAFEFRGTEGLGKLYAKSVDISILDDTKDAIELVNLASETSRVVLNRPDETRQSAFVERMPGGQNALRLQWDNSAAKHFEFSLADAPLLPEFGRVQVRVRAYVPADAQARNLSLRLRDRDGEIFQFPAVIAAGPEGWRDFYYDIDSANPKAASWGPKANKQIDFPVRLQGFAGEFKSTTGTGWLGFSTVGLNALLGGQGVTLDLKTGNPIRVLVPGEEKNLGLSLRGSPFAENATPVSIDYTVTDVSGKTVATEKLEKPLAPRGGETFVPLPAPEKFGVYYMDVAFSEAGVVKKNG